MRRFDIAIAGELNLDLILYGLPVSMPLERELLASDFRLTLGSSSAIVAHNLASLGVRVGFITKFGTDTLGTIALERLAGSGVNLDRITRTPSLSTGLTVLLPHEVGRHILTYPGTIASMTYADLDLDYLCNARHFHLSSFFLQSALRPDLPKLLEFLKRKGLTISLDTNDDPEDTWDGVEALFPWADVLLPNEREACKLTGANDVDEALNRLSQHVPLVVVKRGEAGAMVQRGADRWVADPIPVKALDTIGAGDSFNAGFLVAYLRLAHPLECARMGNIAGALSTLRPGGTESFRDEAFRNEFLQQHGYVREA